MLALEKKRWENQRGKEKKEKRLQVLEKHRQKENKLFIKAVIYSHNTNKSINGHIIEAINLNLLPYILSLSVNKI